MTSLEPIPQEPSQAADLPQLYEGDFHGVGGGFDSQTDHIPLDLEADLGGGNATAQPPTVVPDSQTISGRTLMGIKSSTPLDLQSPHEEAMNQIWEVYRSLASNETCPHDEITQGVECLEVIKAYFNSKRAKPPPSTLGSERDRESFQCFLCEAQQKPEVIFLSFGSLKRHLGSKHEIYDSEFRCPHCHRVFFRRDRIREHLSLIHQIKNPKPDEVESTRVRISHRSICPVCPKDIQHWEQFFRHVKDHCLIRPEAISAPANGAWSRFGGRASGTSERKEPRRRPFVGGQSHTHGHSRPVHGNQPWNPIDFLHPDSEFGHPLGNPSQIKLK